MNVEPGSETGTNGGPLGAIHAILGLRASELEGL